MSFYVYMLKSLNPKKGTYVGYTIDLKKRITLHNRGKGAKFTRGHQWKIIYKKKFTSKNKAMSYEYKLKNNRKLRLSILKEVK